MTNCIECENETILKYAELECDKERLEDYCTLLENCLKAQTDMNKFLSNENEELRNKNAVYQQAIKNLREKYEQVQESE